MTTPMSPGWYPAPDGTGEQWWNGAGWSEGRRGTDGTTPGLPGYRAAPPVAPQPVPLGAPNPYAQPAPTAPGTAGAARVASNPGMVGLIFGALGIIVFAPLGVAGIVLGIVGLRRAGGTSTTRGMSIGAIVLGAVSLVIGLVQLVIFIVTMSTIDIIG